MEVRVHFIDWSPLSYMVLPYRHLVFTWMNSCTEDGPVFPSSNLEAQSRCQAPHGGSFWPFWYNSFKLHVYFHDVRGAQSVTALLGSSCFPAQNLPNSWLLFCLCLILSVWGTIPSSQLQWTSGYQVSHSTSQPHDLAEKQPGEGLSPFRQPVTILPVALYL